MAAENNISVIKTARYFSLGPMDGDFDTVWFVLHGYGQLASYFIRHFESLDDGNTLIIAPEGMHRFYNEGVAGRVGASWMTKEDRENDIRDYVHYLNEVYHQVMRYREPEDIKVRILGFSQGGATACRWVANRIVKVDQVVLWASSFPPDLNFDADRRYFNELDLQVLIGDQDEFIDADGVQKQKALFDKMGLKYTFTGFKGKHTIVPKVLKHLADNF